MAAVIARHTEGLGCELEVRGDELSRKGSSYSWETIKTLKTEYPGFELLLIIGEDNLASFPRWRNWDWILSQCGLAVVPRFQCGATRSLPDELEDYADSVHFIESPVVPVSSTEIRSIMRSGESPGDRINPEIHEYIRKNSIYLV